MVYISFNDLLIKYFSAEQIKKFLKKIGETYHDDKQEAVDLIESEWEKHGNSKYDVFKKIDMEMFRQLCKEYGIDSKGKRNELIKRVKKKKLLGTDNTTNDTSSKIGNTVIIILVVIIFSTAIFVFINGVIPLKTITMTTSGGFITKQSPDFPPDIEHIIKFKTTSLSAQNPIEIEAKMIPSNYFLEYDPDPWPYLPQKQYLLFPFALQYPLKQTPDGDYFSAFIELTKIDEPREYSGNGKIIFQTSGDHGFVFVGPIFMEEHATDIGSESTLNELKERINEHSTFQVDPDQSAVLNGTKYSVVIGLIGLAIGVIRLRYRIMNVVGQ